MGTLTSARLAGLREWQGQKYPTTQWPTIIDVGTHERLVKVFGDPTRRKHVVRAPAHLLSGIATCPKCGQGLHYRWHAQKLADSYGCVKARPDAAGRQSRQNYWRNTCSGSPCCARERRPSSALTWRMAARSSALIVTVAVVGEWGRVASPPFRGLRIVVVRLVRMSACVALRA